LSNEISGSDREYCGFEAISKEISDFDREYNDFEGAVDAISNIPVFRPSSFPAFRSSALRLQRPTYLYISATVPLGTPGRV
jgi:hypothetical protein